MPVSVARRIAFDVLLRVESESAYASELLHAALAPEVKPSDAALATELAMGVLRWRRLLDFLLDRQLKKPVARLDPLVAIALRIGMYQLRFLQKVPARAAVNESVELVKRARKSSAGALVNAVLRRASGDARAPIENFLPPSFPLAERLGIIHSHPTWIVDRWLAGSGEAAAITLLQANNRPSHVSIALHDSAHRDQVLHELKASGLRIAPGHLLKDAFAASGGSVTRTEPFRAGQISIQDEASQTVPLLLDVRPGDRVLDLCAAPGGKTVALAHAAGSNGLVIAAELHEHRLRSMREQLSRLGIAIAECAEDRLAAGKEAEKSPDRAARIRLATLDATQPLPFSESFDRILVDAPCSGTGTLARHPEIRWRLHPDRLGEFRALQSKLLRNALAQLARGGRLVYSTCSIEPEENESVVAEALNSSGSVRLASAAESAQLLKPQLAPGIDAEGLFDSDGYFRTSPPKHRTDGFFAAVLEKY